MKVLVTGATGYVGGGVVRALREAGHDVHALVRDERRVLVPGVRPAVGDLADAASLTSAAEGVDGVIHTAASKEDRDGELDALVAEAFLRALAGSGRFYIHTNGTWVLGDTGGAAAGEEAPFDPPAIVAWRPAVEAAVRAGAARDVRTVVVRPSVVFGAGGGYVPQVLDPTGGVVRYFGDGSNRWSAVHVDDLGDLYRLAAERAPAGSVYNAVADVVVAREAAQAAADAAGVRAEPWSPAEAEEVWGGAVEAFLLDHVVSADRARRELGWTPRRHGLLDELRTARLPLAS